MSIEDENLKKKEYVFQLGNRVTSLILLFNPRSMFLDRQISEESSFITAVKNYFSNSISGVIFETYKSTLR